MQADINMDVTDKPPQVKVEWNISVILLIRLLLHDTDDNKLTLFLSIYFVFLTILTFLR